MDRRTLATYGVGHFGKTLLWSASSLTFAFFLTEVVGLRPALMGQILALSLLFNALVDAAMGHWLRHRAHDLRSAGAIHVAGAVLAAFAFLAFALTSYVHEAARAAYAMVTLLVFRLGYSAFDVPQNAMLSLAVGDDAMRGRMTTTRYAAAGLAAIAVSLFLTQWIALEGFQARSNVFVVIAATLGAVAVLTACATTHALRLHVELAPAAPFAPGPPPPVFAILLSIAIYSGIMPIFVKLQPYFVAFAPRDTFAVAQFITIAALGQVAAQPAWARLSARTSLVFIFQFAALALATTGLMFIALAPGGGFGLIVTALCFGAASSGTLVGIWALMATASAASNIAAVRHFGIFTFVSKSAQAAGILAVGYILDGASYRTGSDGFAVTSWMGWSVVCAGASCVLVSYVWLKPRYRNEANS